jgi:hypothetical protein
MTVTRAKSVRIITPPVASWSTKDECGGNDWRGFYHPINGRVKVAYLLCQREIEMSPSLAK